MRKEQRSETSCRRSNKDRRQTENCHYKGPERRSGQNRRAVKGLAIGMLAGALFLSGTENVTAGRRRTDTVLPQNTELILKQTPERATERAVLYAKALSRYQPTDTAPVAQPETTQNATAKADQTPANNPNGNAFPTGMLNQTPLTSLIVTANREASVSEGSVEISSPYQGPPTGVERTKYRLYPSSGPVGNKTDRTVLASLLPVKSPGKIITLGDSLQVKKNKGETLKDTAAARERGKTERSFNGLDLHLTSYYSKSHLLLTRPGFTGPNGHGSISHEPYTSKAFDFELTSVLKGAAGSGILDVGAALTTHVLLHEFGHHIVADHVEATGAKLNFLTSKNGQFFLASSTVESIDERSRLPYNMGGEWAADLTFEFALNSYRRNPNLYNKSLLFFSGTDLLWYSLYAFYLSDGNIELDPIAITTFNNISKEALLSVALTKSIINAYRIYSGNDTIIPSFSIDKESVTINLTMIY